MSKNYLLSSKQVSTLKCAEPPIMLQPKCKITVIKRSLNKDIIDAYFKVYRLVQTGSVQN